VDDRDVASYWEGNAAAWTALVRAGHDYWRDLVNTPAFLAMLPPIRDLNGLDIGCGEGANTRALANLGAQMTGIDISPTFVEHAQDEEAREPRGIAYLCADATALPFDDGTFMFATAFMSLMDMADYLGALREVRRVIRPGGFFQFSILHPCFVLPERQLIADASGRVVAVQVGGYFDQQPFVEEWMFHSAGAEDVARWRPFRIPYFPRTLSEYMNAVVDAGFALERASEPSPSEELVREHPRLSTLRAVANLLHLRCRKP
jgi:ubiquinone/menaquinone biosynthesis C-methylase UbiE